MKQRLRHWQIPDWRFVGLVVAACVPALVALRIQVRHWTNIPIWDEWDTPGYALLKFFRHSLTWSDLFGQHNESRKVVPRLLHIAIASIGGWDVRQGMVLAFVCACCVSALAFFYLRQRTGKASPSLLFAWLVVNLFLFAPSQYENYLSGFIYEFFIPVLCLFGCIAVNLSSWRLSFRVATNSVLALIATYTFAHGMLLWFLALPLLPPQSTRSKLVTGWIAYVVAGVIAITVYFVGYFKPPVAPPSAGIAQWPELGAFLIMWLGAPLRSAWVSPWITGAIAATAIIAAVGLAFFVMARNRSAWKTYYPWLLLLGLSLMSGLLTAIGRVNLGIDAVFNTRFEGFSGIRYNMTSMFAYVALVGLLFHVWNDWLRFQVHLRTRILVGLSSSCTLLAVAWTHVFAEESSRVGMFQENRRRARAAITWIKILPENPEIFYAYPYPEDFSHRPLEMQRLGIIKVPIADDELGAKISAMPGAANYDYGSMDKVEPGFNGRFRFFGWARNPHNNKRVDYVVLGWDDGAGSFHPFTVLLTGSLRLDVVKVFNAWSLKNSGFNQEIDLSKLPPEADVIRGWGVDFEAKKVFPLGGSVRLGRVFAH